MKQLHQLTRADFRSGEHPKGNFYLRGGIRHWIRSEAFGIEAHECYQFHSVEEIVKAIEGMKENAAIAKLEVVTHSDGYRDMKVLFRWERSSYRVLGPDGIDLTPDPFATFTAAQTYRIGWVERFRSQGYYHDARMRRIPLEDLPDLCPITVVPSEDSEPIPTREGVERCDNPEGGHRRVRVCCRKCGERIMFDFAAFSLDEAAQMLGQNDYPRECPGHHVELSGWDHYWRFEDALAVAFPQEYATALAELTPLE